MHNGYHSFSFSEYNGFNMQIYAKKSAMYSRLLLELPKKAFLDVSYGFSFNVQSFGRQCNALHYFLLSGRIVCKRKYCNREKTRLWDFDIFILFEVS